MCTYIIEAYFSFFYIIQLLKAVKAILDSSYYLKNNLLHIIKFPPIVQTFITQKLVAKLIR